MLNTVENMELDNGYQENNEINKIDKEMDDEFNKLIDKYSEYFSVNRNKKRIFGNNLLSSESYSSYFSADYDNDENIKSLFWTLCIAIFVTLISLIGNVYICYGYNGDNSNNKNNKFKYQTFEE